MSKNKNTVSSSHRQKLLTLLRQLRLDSNLRQADLATLLRQPQSFVSKYESGERRLDILELRQICDALGVTLLDFVRRFENLLSQEEHPYETR